MEPAELSRSRHARLVVHFPRSPGSHARPGQPHVSGTRARQPRAHGRHWTVQLDTTTLPIARAAKGLDYRYEPSSSIASPADTQPYQGPPPGTRAKRPDRQHRPDSLRGPQPGSTWLEDSKLCLTPLSRRTVPIVGRKASCLDEHTIWTRVNKAGPAWQHLATKHRLVAHPCQANAGLPTRDVVRRQPDSGTRCPVAPFVLEDS